MEYKNKVLHGDCLELMKDIPDKSIDMILCDPPYGNMKNAPSTWNKEKTRWDTILDTEKLFEEYNRLLRVNGCIVLFSQEPYTSNLILSAHGNLPFSYRMIWLKDSFGNHLLAKTAPVSFFEDIVVFFKKYDTTAENPVRIYSKKILDHVGKNIKQVNTALGHRKAEHFFYVESTQFSLCTEQVYEEIVKYFKLDEEEWFVEYEDLKKKDSSFREQSPKIFNLPRDKKSKSNVLFYPKDKGGKHPTQKPVALFEDLIKTYTNEGDIVLDNCAGSFTTAIAAENTKRNWICIEQLEEYCEIGKKRINENRVRLGILDNCDIIK